MHRVIDQDPYLRPTRTSRNGLMANVFVMWSVGFFTPLVFSTTGGMGWAGSLNLLQKAGGHARPETTEAIPRCYQLAKVQAIICRCPIIHHVRPRD